MRAAPSEDASISQAFARGAFHARCEELRRALYAIAGGVDLLDAAVLEPGDRGRLVLQLRRRVDCAVDIVVHAMRLVDAGPLWAVDDAEGASR